MHILRNAFTRLQPRLLGMMGVGSLLLIFIAGQLTERASDGLRTSEQNAMAAIETIAQARFDVSLLGVAGTRYLDSLDPQQAENVTRYLTSIAEHLASIGTLLPRVTAAPEYQALLTDLSDYKVAFDEALAVEQRLGLVPGTGLRADFAATVQSMMDAPRTGNSPADLKTNRTMLFEAGRLTSRGTEFATTILPAQIDIEIAALERVAGLNANRSKRLSILRDFKEATDRYIAGLRDQDAARSKLRNTSRSASENFLLLTARINDIRNDLRSEAERTRTTLDAVNIGFSAAVALAFIVLSRILGVRMRAQAAAISSSEQRFRRLVETIADFAVETDAKLIIRQTFVSPSYRPAVNPAALIGRPIFEPSETNPYRIEMDAEKIQDIFAKRETFRDFEYRVITDGGPGGWRRCYGSPYYDDQGNFAGYRVLAQDVSAQKEAEWYRNESDAAYRAIATAAFGAFYRIDNAGRIISLEGIRNQPAAIMHIQRPGRLIWETMAELGIRYPEHIDLEKKVLNGEPFDDVEVQVFNTDGSIRGWYIHRGVPIRDANGHTAGYVVAVASITHQKRLEIESKLKTQELERIIATMPGAFFRLSGASPETATIEFMSPGIFDILGYRPDEITNRPGLNLTMPNERETSYFEVTSSNDAIPAMQEKRVRLRRKDGSTATVIEKPVEIATLPDGRKVVEGLLIDISDLSQRDIEITERRRQLEAIVANLPGWVYGFSFKDGRYTRAFCAGATERILGHTGESLLRLLAKDPGAIIHPDDVKPSIEKWNSIRTSKENGEYEHHLRMIGHTGKVLSLTDKGRVTCDPDGTVHIDGIVLDVSQEARIQTENDIIKSAVDAASDVICVLDNEGKGIYANQAFKKFAELPADAQIQSMNLQRVGRFMAPDDQSYRLAVSAALSQTGRYRGELDWESPSGRRRRLDMTITRTKDSHDVMIVRDVTSIRAAADHRNRLNMAAARVGIARGGFLSDFRSGIQELTQIAANALEVAQVGVWLFNDENRESYTALDIYDRRSDRHSEGAVHYRADYPLYFAALDLMRNIVAHDAANDPVTREFKTAYLEPNGITGLLDTPIFRAGKVLGVLCIERDGPVRRWLDEEIAFATVIADSIAFGIEAEERKVAERRVVTVNSQLNRVVKALDSSQDNIIIEDENGQIAYMNARAAHNTAVTHTGLEPSAVSTMKFGDLFPHFAKRRTEAAADIERALNEHGTWEDHIDFRHHNGRRVQMELRIGRLPDGGLICVATDITERRRHEEQQDALRMQLAEAQKMEAIGRLAGGIAHDFNNIIAAVAAYASVMAGDSCSNEQHAVYASKIKTICGRASDIVKQILLFAKAKTATHEPIFVNNIVEEARDLLATSLPASVEVRLIDHAANAVVMGSGSQLLQILLNLGLNSGDAINEKNGYIEITVDEIVPDSRDADGTDRIVMRTDEDIAVTRSLRGALIPGHRYIRITVRDNGPGIPNDVLERIYEPFFSTKEKSKGTGLGLPVVHSIVNAHNGAIEIRTTVGHGTRFLIYLPASDHVAKVTVDEATKINTCRGRILIVDDEVDLADAMSILLTKAGFETAPVYSPEEAIELFAEDPMAWDLVLTDQVMPKMKGVTMAKRLLKLRPSLPIILHTGYSESASAEIVKAAGIRALLYKPVEGPTLIQHIMAALKTSAT